MLDAFVDPRIGSNDYNIGNFDIQFFGLSTYGSLWALIWTTPVCLWTKDDIPTGIFSTIKNSVKKIQILTDQSRHNSDSK